MQEATPDRHGSTHRPGTRPDQLVEDCCQRQLLELRDASRGPLFRREARGHLRKGVYEDAVHEALEEWKLFGNWHSVSLEEACRVICRTLADSSHREMRHAVVL